MFICEAEHCVVYLQKKPSAIIVKTIQSIVAPNTAVLGALWILSTNLPDVFQCQGK